MATPCQVLMHEITSLADRFRQSSQGAFLATANRKAAARAKFSGKPFVTSVVDVSEGAGLDMKYLARRTDDDEAKLLELALEE